MPDIYLDQPSLGKLESDYVARAMREGEISTRSKYVDLFEESLSRTLGASSVIATNSGTMALFAASTVLFPGATQIAMPALTFIATYNAIRKSATPVVIHDVGKDDWVLHLSGSDTLPVDLYGVLSCCPEALLTDASQAFGRIMSNAYVLSFNHNKTITCGGGGAILNLSNVHTAWVRAYISQGLLGDHRPINGFNGRMTGLHASVGLAQMERADELLDKKRTLHTAYADGLDGVVKFQAATAGSTRWMTACTTPVPATHLQYELARSGVPTRRVFVPLHMLVSHPTVCPNAERIYHYGLCLPSSTLNSLDTIKLVCKLVKRAIKEYKPL